VSGKGRNGGVEAFLVGSRKRGRYFEPPMSSSRRVIPLLNAHTGMALKVAIQPASQASDFLFIHQSWSNDAMPEDNKSTEGLAAGIGMTVVYSWFVKERCRPSC